MNNELNKDTLDALRVQMIGGAYVVPKDFRIVPSEIVDGHTEDCLGRVQVESLGSLINYTKTYSHAEQVAIFINEEQIEAVLDWHAGTEPGTGTHRVKMLVGMTTRLKAWLAINGRQLAQKEFAEFVEEHLEDIKKPSAADMLTIATTLEGKRNVEFAMGQRLANGDQQVKWQEKTEAKTAGDIKIPTELTICVPVLKGMESVTTFELRILFRYRVHEGRLSFELKILGTDQVMEAALEAATAAVLAGFPDMENRIFRGKVIERPLDMIKRMRIG